MFIPLLHTKILRWHKDNIFILVTPLSKHKWKVSCMQKLRNVKQSGCIIGSSWKKTFHKFCYTAGVKYLWHVESSLQCFLEKQKRPLKDHKFDSIAMFILDFSKKRFADVSNGLWRSLRLSRLHWTVMLWVGQFTYLLRHLCRLYWKEAFFYKYHIFFNSLPIFF